MAALPKIPVVAIIEGRCPKPEPKRAFQKIVLLTAAGLNLSQLYKKYWDRFQKQCYFLMIVWLCPAWPTTKAGHP